MNKHLAVLVALLLAAQPLHARAEAAAIPAAPAATAGPHVLLPQTRPYQKQLRDFMATLKEVDFQPDPNALTVVPFDAKADADEKFRTYVLSAAPFAVGFKRNYSSVRVHPSMFTLGSIERDAAIMRLPAHPEPLVDLANWHYAGNPHDNSRALRLRAFVVVAVDMMMLDQLIEHGTEKEKPRQDQLLGQILRFAYTIPALKDAVPADVHAALLDGLKPLVRRALDRGARTHDASQGMTTWAIPALCLASQILNDPAITKDAEAYAQTLCTDPRFFDAAGYFVNGGTLDSFNGISTWFALWGAAADHAPYVVDAIAKIYRLRAHLALPEPDGSLVGPSHMSSLTSPEPTHDQWNFPARPWAAALVTDEAACLAKLPTDEQLNDSIKTAVDNINSQINELSTAPHGLESAPWKNEPAGTLVNYAYQYYPKGYAARRAALEKTDLAKLPALRAGGFVHAFADEFVFAKTPAHIAIIYTGPTREATDPESGVGLGGGALSAFWTPSTGAVILGRGVGAWSPMYKKMFEAWRSIPTHAVTGATADGKIFTSAHIDKPELKIDAKENSYSVMVHGPIPQTRDKETLLTGVIDYTRQFDSTANGVHIATTIKSDGKDSLAELYETIPVFLRDLDHQPNVVPTTIDFQSDGKWSPASETLTTGVTAIRLHRFDGTVDIVFDQPCKAKIAPEWMDKYMSHAVCRNILIDLLETKKVSYRIEPAAK